jgi:Transposase DDE domain
MPIEAGMTYVYDKGYHDFGWWHRLDAAGAFFVSRLKINTKRRDVQADIGPLERGILGDNRLKIGHKPVLSFAEGAPRAGTTNPLFDKVLREIVVERDGKAPLVLITNDHSRPASEIAALYKERWQIELLFKWIKQNLKIKRFLGRSENAVKIQIYVALIAWLSASACSAAAWPRQATPKACLSASKPPFSSPSISPIMPNHPREDPAQQPLPHSSHWLSQHDQKIPDSSARRRENDFPRSPDCPGGPEPNLDKLALIAQLNSPTE